MTGRRHNCGFLLTPMPPGCLLPRANGPAARMTQGSIGSAVPQNEPSFVRHRANFGGQAQMGAQARCETNTNRQNYFHFKELGIVVLTRVIRGPTLSFLAPLAVVVPSSVPFCRTNPICSKAVPSNELAGIVD
jgi:hypothetical protein